jgi:hypothetical protein
MGYSVCKRWDTAFFTGANELKGLGVHRAHAIGTDCFCPHTSNASVVLAHRACPPMTTGMSYPKVGQSIMDRAG